MNAADDRNGLTADGADAVAPELPGPRLKKSRREHNLRIEDVAGRLNLDVYVVEALESNDYRRLPEAAYIRGYLLSYIRLLGLPETLLQPFDARFRLQPPLRPTGTIAAGRRREQSWVRYISGSLIVLLVLLVGAWLVERSFHVLERLSEGQVAAAPPAQPEPAAAVAETAAPSIEQTEDAAPQDTLPPQTTAADGSAVEAAAVADDIAPTEAEPPLEVVALPQPASAELVITFRDESWVQVDDGYGRRLRSGVFSRQDWITLTGQPPFSITIGRPRNVTVIYQGEAVDLARYYGRRSPTKLTLGP